MVQLHPQETFVIYRQLADHTDTSTYYVRAVIRDAKTAALIETVNLTDNGNGDFTGNWQVIADTSGQGKYIKVVTSVYTDAGYTTKSQNHADEGETYLIQDRLQRLGGGGGGYNAPVDYERIERIIDKIIKKKMAEHEEVYYTEMQSIKESFATDHTSLSSAIADVFNRIEGLDFIQQKDLKPLVRGLVETKQVISNLPPPQYIDLQPIHNELKKIKQIEKKSLEGTKKISKEIIEELKSAVNNVKKTVKKMPVNFSLNLNAEQKKKEKKKPLF